MRPLEGSAASRAEKRAKELVERNARRCIRQFSKTSFRKLSEIDGADDGIRPVTYVYEPLLYQLSYSGGNRGTYSERRSTQWPPKRLFSSLTADNGCCNELANHAN